MLSRNLNKSFNLISSSFKCSIETSSSSIGISKTIFKNSNLSEKGYCNIKNEIVFKDDLSNNDNNNNNNNKPIKKKDNKKLKFYLAKIQRNPTFTMNYYNLTQYIEKNKHQNKLIIERGKPIQFLGSNENYKLKDIYALELEYNPEGDFYGLEENGSFKSLLIYKIFYFLDSMKKETVKINNKVYDKFEIAKWFLNQDPLNKFKFPNDHDKEHIENGDEIVLNFIKEYLYITGNESLTLSNGNKILKDPNFKFKYNFYINYQNENNNNLVKEICELVDDNNNCDDFILYEKFNKLLDKMNNFEKFQIFKDKGELDKNEIIIELIKRYPNITFGNWLLIKSKFNSFNPNEDIKEIELYKDMILMDIENINKNNQLFKYNDKIEFKIMYSNLLNLTSIFINGDFNQTTIKINNQLITKLNLILNCWEYSNNFNYPGCKYCTEKQIISYFNQTGRLSIKTQSGKEIKYNIINETLEIIK